MLTGIYKIENKVNKKCYIGQSANIEKRWKNHLGVLTRKQCHLTDYPLYRAFRKYGIENFDFSIVEQCSLEMLSQRESYWINYFNSNISGYNQTTNSCVDRTGEFSGYLADIVYDLKETSLPLTVIAKNYGLTKQSMSAINNGRVWFNEFENYPLRKKLNQDKLLPKTCRDCGCAILNKATRCISCNNLEISKRFQISKLGEHKARPSIEQLEELIRQYPLTKIGKMYGVSNNAVKKWYKKYGISYNHWKARVVK